MPVGKLAGNNIFEKTVPCTNDFFVPQNCAVILSSRLNESHSAILPVIKYMMKNKATTANVINSNSIISTDAKMLLANASAKLL